MAESMQENAWSTLVRKCLSYTLTLFYTSLYCLWLLIYALLNPGKKFWEYKERSPPKFLQDATYGTHKFAKVNNINIHYVENGNKDKPLMLFIHGFPEFWYSWRHQIVEFSKDYWTVAVDLRGYGDSDRPWEQSNYHMRNILEDIRQLVKHLDRKKFVLVAHDWGGVLAWNFLDLHPEMVSQFIIMAAPHCRSWIRVMASNPKQFLFGWYTFFFQFPILPEFSVRFNDFQLFDKALLGDGSEDVKQVREAYKYMFSRKDAVKSGIDYYRANMGKIILTRETPKNLPPGLFILGENDKYIVTAYLDMAKELIPNLQTLCLKDCNHFMQQTSPKIVNASIRNFLNKFEMVNGVK